MDAVFNFLLQSIKSAHFMDWDLKIRTISIKTAHFMDRVFQFQQPSTKKTNIVDAPSNPPQM